MKKQTVVDKNEQSTTITEGKKKGMEKEIDVTISLCSFFFSSQ